MMGPWMQHAAVRLRQQGHSLAWSLSLLVCHSLSCALLVGRPNGSVDREVSLHIPEHMHVVT